MAEPKKAVYGVEIYNDKCKKKAMKAISSLEGIQSINMNMKDKKLTVVGVINPVCGYKKLTKVCNTEILLVEPIKKEKVETAPKVDPKPKVVIVEPSIPFPYQVNVSLIVGADPTIGLRRESWLTLRFFVAFGARCGRHLRRFEIIPSDSNRDTLQLETVVSTISQEYLIEFTSEYGISEDLNPELPGPEERIVDFPEGKLSVIGTAKQETREKHPSMLYQAVGFPKKLKQPILLGGREGISYYCELAHKCSKGRDASQEHLFRGGYDDTEHTSHPHPKTTRNTVVLVGLSWRYYLGDDVYPTFLHDDDRGGYL
nr:heavy metal-associated isoprenylated plant protein 39 [Tanacetum cinerariifolium]